jgi:hypothetical protein
MAARRRLHAIHAAAGTAQSVGLSEGSNWVLLSQAAAQPLLSGEAMIAVAGKLDLVNNVFQNGVHGSLRNTLVDVRAPQFIPATHACRNPSHSLIRKLTSSTYAWAYFQTAAHNL